MLPEPLRLALAVVGEPEYGKVEVVNRDKSSKIVPLDNSAVGLVLEVFRSVQAQKGLSDEEKKQRFWQLLREMGKSPFVQRGSMRVHCDYIVEKIWCLPKQGDGNKGQKIRTTWPELDRLDFNQLYQFAGWIQRLHEAALKHRESLAGLCQPASGSGSAAARNQVEPGQHGGAEPSRQRAGQGQAVRVSPESGRQTIAPAISEAGGRQTTAPANTEAGRQAAVQVTSNSESMSSEYLASLLQQNERLRVSKSNRKK
ncbi:hypothetical protein [Desulfurispora thermophila]|uniref:hypothetical protein n=1 Tax=Desulfurispora thermophila TaxID=265470 RepID=UPI0003623479|nr:hypothetical protein [Desulfurispora thermophila]